MAASSRWVRGVRLVVVAAVVAALGALGPLAPPVRAVSADVVISQVYGGGGNSGAPYKNDYIELYNLGASAVTMTNWSVQYQSSTGATWAVTAFSGTLNPGQYFLIREASGGANGADGPTPDATGAINLSATAGKVALVTTATALTCSTNATCLPNAAIKDLVGFGVSTNAVYEGAGPAPAPSNTTADWRKAQGATDTDDNRADFAAVAPCPRNTALPADTCVAPAAARIRDIQGAAHRSPKNGQGVTGVPGIVTLLKPNGFFMQDSSPDADDATSEGIFVFTNSAPTVAVGDSITVSGTVSEFRPGGSGGVNNLTTTEITGPTITPVASGLPLPAAIIVGAGGRLPPATVIEDDATGDVETSGVFDPASDAIDFYESLEGMRVQINDAVAVGPRNAFGETPVLPDGGAGLANRTARGGIYISDYANGNPRRLILTSGSVPTPTMNVRDSLPGATVGVLDYSFGNFMLALSAVPAVVSGGLTKETTATPTADQLAIATINLANLDPGDDAAKFNGLAAIIASNLQSPDIIALEEVQDNTGPTDDGTVEATTTANMLIAAIAAAGGPAYQYRDIPPVNDQDGGEPGGNIRVAFLFRTDRGVAFVDRPGGGPTTAVSVVTDGTGTHLSTSPGRIAPTDPAFANSRKPLAAEFTFNGQRLSVIVNHFNSKGGDTPLFGRVQPPTRSSEVQRQQQAAIVHDFVQSLLAADADAKVVVLGDLNDFQFSPALATLRGAPAILTDLITTLPASDQYTYIFEGNAQVLDHILVTNNLVQPSLQYDVVHVNTEFADQASDHDPQIVRLTLVAAPPPAPTVVAVTPNQGGTGGGTSVTITGTNFQPGATVTFDTAAATNVTVTSGTTITATAPTHAAGAVDVTVTNPDTQSATGSGAYTYVTPDPLPVARSAAPASGGQGNPPDPLPSVRSAAATPASGANPLPPPRP